MVPVSPVSLCRLCLFGRDHQPLRPFFATVKNPSAPPSDDRGGHALNRPGPQTTFQRFRYCQTPTCVPALHGLHHLRDGGHETLNNRQARQDLRRMRDDLPGFGQIQHLGRSNGRLFERMSMPSPGILPHGHQGGQPPPCSVRYSDSGPCGQSHHGLIGHDQAGRPHGAQARPSKSAPGTGPASKNLRGVVHIRPRGINDRSLGYSTCAPRAFSRTYCRRSAATEVSPREG